MIKIAHRGNFDGKRSTEENTIRYINLALCNGYDVEVDVRLHGDVLYLGHDSLQEAVDINYLRNPRFWVHSKTFETHMLLASQGIHCFFHDSDPYVFTTRGIKWCRAGVETTDGVVVMPELDSTLLHKIQQLQLKPLAVCSDDFTIIT